MNTLTHTRILLISFNILLLNAQYIDQVYVDTDGLKDLRGSIMGGTRLWINGIGFSDNPEAGGNQVYVGGTACKVIEYLSQPGTLIVVDTPPLDTVDDHITYTIDVYVDGRYRISYNGFYYHETQTPLLYKVTPHMGSTDETITYIGNYKDNKLKIGQEGSFREIALGQNGRCIVPNQEDHQQEDMRYAVDCQLERSMTPGYYNTTLTVARHYGKAYIDTAFQYYDIFDNDTQTYQVNQDNQIYMFEVVPSIKKTSHWKGSIAGGLELKIEGTGFTEDISAIQVAINQDPCEVISSTAEEIICRTPAQLDMIGTTTTDDLYIGNRGVRRQIFKNRDKLFYQSEEASEFTETPYMEDIITTIETEYRRDDNYEQKLTTLFRPRISSNHTFYYVVDDYMDVFLAPFNNLSDITQVFEVRLYNYRFLSEHHKIKSSPIYLEQDKYYLITIFMAEFLGKDYLTLGVSYAAEDETFQYNSMREVQALEIKIGQQYEIQRISIKHAVDGYIRLGYITVKNGYEELDVTELIHIKEITTSYIMDEVKKLSTLESSSISVYEIKNENNEYIYDIEFKNIVNYQREYIQVYSTLECNETCDIQVERLQNGSYPLGGTFNIIYNGVVSGSLGCCVGGGDLETALNELTLNTKRFKVKKYTYSDKITYYITFCDDYGPVGDQLKLNITNLYGGLNNNTISTEAWTVIQGSSEIIDMPIASDMLFVAETRPQVTVKVNSILSRCDTENKTCDFEVTWEQTPLINDMEIEANEEIYKIRIIGEKLIKTREVLIGDKCQIVNITDVEINCKLNVRGPAGIHKVIIYVEDYGYALHNNGNEYIVENELMVLDINPRISSMAGGTEVRIKGYGFQVEKTQLNITLCDKLANIVSYNSTDVLFETPSCQSDSIIVTGKLTANNKIAYFNLTYDNFITIQDIIPKSGSTVLTTTLKIIGSGFQPSSGDVTSVYIKDSQCNIKTVSDTEITCDTEGGNPGTYPVMVQIKGLGNSTAEDIHFTYELEINDIYPMRGSLEGGTLLKIKGKGFGDGTWLDDNVVSIGLYNSPCIVISQNYTEIQCITGTIENVAPELPVNLDVALKHNYAKCNMDSCNFTYSEHVTPYIGDIEEDILVLEDGENFEIPAFGLSIGDGMIEVYMIPFDSEDLDRNDLYFYLNNYIKCNNTYFRPDLETLYITVNQTVARFYKVVVYDKIYGFGESNVYLDYRAKITSVYPNEISMEGADLLIEGRGFYNNLISNNDIITTIKANDTNCEILSINSNQIICRIGSGADFEIKHINITIATENSISSISSARHLCENEECIVTYFEEMTPELNSIEYIKEEIGYFKIGFRGKGFVSNEDGYLTIREDNDVKFENTTYGYLEIYNMASGTHDIRIHHNNIGFIKDKYNLLKELKQELNITYEREEGSVMGGKEITIKGHGFDIYNISNNKIEICGVNCLVTSVLYDEIRCLTLVHLTEENAQLFNLDEIINLNGYGTIISTNDDQEHYGFDQDYTTHYQSSNSECYLGRDFGENKSVKLKKIRIHPQIYATGGSSATEAILYSEIQGSNDGEHYEEIIRIEKKPIQGYNDYEIVEDVMSYRYIRYKSLPENKCKISELELYGILYSNETSCDLEIEVNGNRVLIQSGFDHLKSKTPNITNIAPNMGTTAGNTLVTITGDFMTNDKNEVEVKFDGIECRIEEMTETEIRCITGKRTHYQEARTEIMIKPYGNAAINHLDYKYIDKWSDINTWNGTSLPKEDETIVIPEGQHILLDVSPPRLNLIIIYGILEFDQNQNIELNATYIYVRGKLIIGTETEPFPNKAVITLNGRSEETPELPLYGSKNIAVRYGTLEMHGLPKRPSWTQLSKTLEVGENIISLRDAVNWEIGDKIVIATTSFEFEETEEFEIINNEGKQLTLNKAAKFKHNGEILYYQGKPIDTRAEVAVLTRNVKIQGDEESQKTLFGAHVMLHSPESGSSIGHFENIEFYRCGQAHHLGRYPVHFHLLGSIHNSYIRNCTIHHTYNRAITMHGVKYFTIENNVAYENMGHAYFIEDGIEEDNRIINNLGLVTRSSMSLLDTDVTPATFWITNPNNYIMNNHAAGSERYGFWYDLQEHPTGPSFTLDVCPPGLPLGTFSNNVAHSNGRYGLRIFNNFVPALDACNWQSNSYTSLPAIMNKFISFKNKRNGVVTSLIGDVRFDEFIVMDNLRAGIEIVKLKSPGYGVVSTSNSMIIGQSLNMPMDHIPHELRDDPDIGSTFGLITSGATFDYMIQNTTFINFNQSELYALSSCAHCNFPNNKFNDARFTSFKNVTFENSWNRIKWGLPYKHAFLDLDGSLSSNEASDDKMWITAYWPHLDQDNCSVDEIMWPNSLMCKNNILRLAINRQQPYSNFYDQPLYIKFNNEEVKAEEESEIPYRNHKWLDPSDGWALQLLSNEIYDINWHGIEFEYLYLEVSGMLPGDYFYLRFNYTEYRDHFEIYVNKKEIIPSNIKLPDIVMETGSSYHDLTAKTITVLFNGQNQLTYSDIQELEIISRICPREGCPEPEINDVERESFMRLWSNETQWPNGKLPKAGQDVEIKEAWRLIVDIDTPRINDLLIKGELHFDSNKLKTNLEANTINIMGGEMWAGNASLPFTNELNIVLHGSKSSMPLIVSNDMDIGPKSLAVFGKLRLFGQRRSVIFTYLTKTVKPGDSILYLEDAVDWQIGEELMVTSSSYDQSETEIIKIKSVINEKTVELENELKYKHYGNEIINIINNKGIEIRTEIALITRNIKIKGIESEDRYGVHVYVNELENVNFESSIQMDGVQIVNGGQFKTRRYTLNIRNIKDSFIKRSSFYYNNNIGIYIINTFNFQFENNVIFNTFGSSFEILESNEIAINSNIANLAQRRIDSSGTQLNELLANYVICYWDTELNRFPSTECSNISMNGNIAAGSYYLSYAIAIIGNENEYNMGHSARIGVIFRPERDNKESISISKFLIHHMTQIGITYNEYINRLILKDLILADNRVSIALVPVNGENSGTALITDIILIGNSDNGGCGYDDEIACPNNGNLDRLELGQETYNGCFNRIGYMATVFDSNSKSFPKKVPHEIMSKIEGDAGFGGLVELTGLNVANWTYQDKCGYHNSLLTTNPSASDATPIHHLKDFKYISNIDENALFYMDLPDVQWINPEDCVDMECTGLYNFIFNIKDETIMQKISQIVPNYPMAYTNDIRCEFKLEWNAFKCGNTEFEILNFESLDEDRYSRRIHPVNISNNGDVYEYKSYLNSYMDRRWDDSYTSLLRLSRFPAVVELGKAFSIRFTGTNNPRKLRLGFDGVQDDKGVLIDLKYHSPELHEIYIDNEKVDYELETFKNGAHHWDDLERKLSIYIKGSTKVTIITTNYVQVSMKLAMTVDEFYDGGGLDIFVRNVAYSLGIDMARIRVVNVISAKRRRNRKLLNENEIDVDVLIVEDVTSEIMTSGDDDNQSTMTTEEAMKELEELTSELNQKIGDGTLLTGLEETLTLVGASVTPPLEVEIPETPCIPSCKDESYCDQGQCKCYNNDYEYISYYSISSMLDEPNTNSDNNETDGCYLRNDILINELNDSSSSSYKRYHIPLIILCGASLITILFICLYGICSKLHQVPNDPRTSSQSTNET